MFLTGLNSEKGAKIPVNLPHILLVILVLAFLVDRFSRIWSFYLCQIFGRSRQNILFNWFSFGLTSFAQLSLGRDRCSAQPPALGGLLCLYGDDENNEDESGEKSETFEPGDKRF